MTTNFAALLAAGKPVLIDGGLATQCEAMGHNIDGELWSARLLQTNPRAIVDATRAYLDAGARVVATASYQASRQGLMATGLTRQAADDLILDSVALARRACSEYLAEYTGDYDISDSDLHKFHEERLLLLDTTDADLFACETIPSGREAAILADLLRDVSRPSWVSFSCRDETHLADGTPVAAAAGYFTDHPKVLALGVNCVPPGLVVPLIAELRSAAPDKAVVVYPNSGEVYRSQDNSWHGTVSPIEATMTSQTGKVGS